MHRPGAPRRIDQGDRQRELTDYIERDEGLADTLHKFRSSGKRLFLLTNSAWDYTVAVMSYLLDGVRGGYPSWRNYFDIIVVSAAKPEFFTEEHPFVELDADGAAAARRRRTGRSSAGASIRAATSRRSRRARTRHGDRVLFIGDHIYGDMLRSRKSSNWRTAMVLQELEHEITMYDRLRPELARLDRLDAELIHLDSELYERQAAMRSLQKLAGESAATASSWRRRSAP